MSAVTATVRGERGPGLVGVLHLPAMPGDPPPSQSFERVRQHAARDASRLKQAGFDALIVENFGSSRFPKGCEGDRLPPHQVAALALVVADAIRETGLPVGVNCLRNDAYTAIGIAAATGAAFIRVNVHAGAYVTDQGIIEGEAHTTLRYRTLLGAHDVEIYADVLVKHASPLAPLEPAQATAEVLDRGRADGVIVTGVGTGQPIDGATLGAVRAAAGDRCVLLGSGLTPERCGLASVADGAIVGTYLKEKGDVLAPVDLERAKRLVDAWRAAPRVVEN